jgi:hypothetical protein
VEYFEAPGGLQIESNTLFIHIEKQEETALFGVWQVLGKGSPTARPIAQSRLFNFDDFRPHLGQQLAAIGARYEIAEFEDFNSRECLPIHLSSPCLSDWERPLDGMAAKYGLYDQFGWQATFL